ncbi:Maf family protein [Collinsella sp. UBA1693]|uniref:Maf family protein n=1 Tax=Collinsella sp. UBA1693 TaxID=1946385 RepID=UPI00257CF3EF|nr:Maf family protein [Collinsella sp. UBA1693]
MILASQSPRRIELMDEAGFTCRVIPADIDETPHEGEQPLDLVGRLAKDKALCVASEHAHAGEIVVAADTIVTIDGVILGKPADAQDAKRMLRLLSGRTHQVATGACVARANAAGDTAEPVLQNFVEVTDVTFYTLDEDTIDEYAQSGEPLDKAGAYGIQGKGGRMLVEKIDGDFYNVVGLPIARVARTIRDMQQD